LTRNSSVSLAWHFWLSLVLMPLVRSTLAHPATAAFAGSPESGLWRGRQRPLDRLAATARLHGAPRLELGCGS